MVTKKLQDKVALITGASRGVGAAVAERYAKEGAHVLLCARTISGLEQTDDRVRSVGGKATIVPIDLMKHDTIDQLGAVIAEKFGKLDILVGNAAMLGVLSPVAHLSPDIWQKVFDLNVVANYRLIRSLDLLLKNSDYGRAIFVTSSIAKSLTPYWGGYASSKAALEAMVKTYAEESQKTRLKVNLVDPGVVATDMRKAAMPGEDSAKLILPEQITKVFVDLALDSCKKNGKLVKASVDKKILGKICLGGENGSAAKTAA